MLMLQIEFWFESVISGYLNLNYPLLTTIGEKLGIALSIFNIINCLIMFPILIIISIIFKDKIRVIENYRIMFNPLTEYINLERDTSTYYYLWFFTRRFLNFVLYVLLANTIFNQV
jgi:hypothetical protein